MVLEYLSERERYNVRVEGGSEIIAVKPANITEIQEPTIRPNATYEIPKAKLAPPLKKGEKAVYVPSGELVSVEKVHSEDDPSDPYYTIRMGSDGREKQTTREKLGLDATLEVSGTIFTVPVSTLCIEGDIAGKVVSLSSGKLSLDRDSELFKTVLAYQRFIATAADKSNKKKPERPELPGSRGGLKKLKKEAEYYGLSGLANMCQDKILDLVL